MKEMQEPGWWHTLQHPIVFLKASSILSSFLSSCNLVCMYKNTVYLLAPYFNIYMHTQVWLFILCFFYVCCYLALIFQDPIFLVLLFFIILLLCKGSAFSYLYICDIWFPYFLVLGFDCFVYWWIYWSRIFEFVLICH